MSSTDLHQLVFKWPGTEPTSVIVTGTFDQWASSIRLVKVPSGFEGAIQIPWAQKVKYKFIVDGEWRLHEDQPTEVDPGGFVNNIYTAPAKPVIPPALEASSPIKAEKSTAANNHTTNSDSAVAQVVDKPEHAPQTSPKSLTGTDDLASTITAHNGVSSTLTYVAPGLGAAMHSAVGIDPINTPKVAVPTPKSDDDSRLPPGIGTTSPTIMEESSPKASTPVAPLITVPVNAAENTTAASSPPPESMHTLPHFAPEPMLKTTPFVPKVTVPVSDTATVGSETSEEMPKNASEQTPVIESVHATCLNNDLAVLSKTATPLSTTVEAEPSSTTSVIPTGVQSTADPEPIVAAVIPPIASNPVTEEKAQTPSSAPDAVDAAVVPEGKVAEPIATPAMPTTPRKKTPTTSSVKDIQDFPSPTNSPSYTTENSPSSSRFNSVRKKRHSILGKIKKLFHHDKEKGMN